MLITARSKLGGKVKALDHKGNLIGTAFACDTTKGWIDMYVLNPGTIQGDSVKVLSDRKKQRFATIRVHMDFDIVTRKDDRKLFQVRWTWTTRKARPIETKFGPLPK